MRPETLRLTIGTTGRWRVTLREEKTLKPVTTYAGTEPLTLVVTEGAYGDQSLSGASGVAWRGRNASNPAVVVTGAAAAAIGQVTITVDNTDTTALGVGTYGLSVQLTDGGEPIEVYRAALVIEPR